MTNNLFHVLAFNFKEICVGCPIEGTEESETALIVTDFVLKTLNETAIEAGLIRNHLTIDKLKQYISKPLLTGGNIHLN